MYSILDEQYILKQRLTVCCDQFVGVVVLPINVADGGGVVVDVQPLRPQISYSLTGTDASPNHKLVRHVLDQFKAATVNILMLALTSSLSVILLNFSNSLHPCFRIHRLQNHMDYDTDWTIPRHLSGG